jgi:hypothetical protein
MSAPAFGACAPYAFISVLKGDRLLPDLARQISASLTGATNSIAFGPMRFFIGTSGASGTAAGYGNTSARTEAVLPSDPNLNICAEASAGE